MKNKTLNIDNIKYRNCYICKEQLELNSNNFNKDKSRSEGFMYNCKSCEKQRTKNKYLKNKRIERYSLMAQEEKRRKVARAKEWRKTDKGRAINLLSGYKKFDKSKNLTFDLDTDWVINNIFKKQCIYCEDQNSPLGCDRIDNTKEHVKENVVPCCKECNIARMNNFTHEEMLIIGKAIKEIKLNRNKIK